MPGNDDGSRRDGLRAEIEKLQQVAAFLERQYATQAAEINRLRDEVKELHVTPREIRVGLDDEGMLGVLLATSGTSGSGVQKDLSAALTRLVMIREELKKKKA